MQSADPASRESKLATNATVKLVGLMCSVAVKLRLCPSSRGRADSGWLDEPGAGVADGDGLLGGDATRPRKQ